MKYSIMVKTESNRGDHAADVQIAYVPVDGETIEALIERIGVFRPTDVIEIRVPRVEGSQ